jgi:haloalkane dehalogenase
MLQLENNVRMHYLDVGKGETLLMLHGNPTWSFYYRKLVEGLSDHYRCIVPDHVGCGLSDKPADYEYTLDNRISNIMQLIDALQLDDITLLVHDWGGPIGYGTALRYPDKFKRFVVFNTAVTLTDMPLAIRMCRWPVWGKILVRGFNGFVRMAMNRCADPERLKGAVGRGYTAPYNSWGNRIAIHQFVVDIPWEDGHRTLKLRNALERQIPDMKDRPHMVIWGAQDFVFDDTYLAGWKEKFPDAEYHYFEDASHWVVEDAHERIVPLIQDFLARHPLD